MFGILKCGLDVLLATTHSLDTMSDEARPKPLFFVVLACVILGLRGLRLPLGDLSQG